MLPKLFSTWRMLMRNRIFASHYTPVQHLSTHLLFPPPLQYCIAAVPQRTHIR